MASTLSLLYSFPHSLGAPGIGTTAWHQVAGLSRRGVDVTVLCTSVARPLPDSVAVVCTLTVAGRRVPHRVLGVSRAYRYHDARAAWWLRRHCRSVDFVHCWPRACLRTIATARRCGVPALRELPNAHTAQTYAAAQRASQDTGVPLPIGYSHRSDERRLATENAEFASADFLLAPSDHVAASFAGDPDAGRRIIRHRYGFDPAVFTPSGIARHRPFTAIFLGRGEPAKGLHFALAAWRLADLGPHARLLVAGRLLPEYERRLAAELADPTVEVLGFVGDVAELLRRADVLVLPTYTEGSALVTYEASGCGVVPLVSEAAGAPVVDGVSGLIHEVGDVAMLAAHLRSCADPVRRAQLRAGVLAAAATLTWDAAADELVAAYGRARDSYRA